MRLIAKRTLRRFWEQPGHEDAKAPLEAWCGIVMREQWKTPGEIKDKFGNVSICGNNRAIFNVGGNKYRLVVEMQYRAGIVWVKFIGTHEEYDRIEVETVNEY
jgi:mRNA interferase HigB